MRELLEDKICDCLSITSTNYSFYFGSLYRNFGSLEELVIEERKSGREGRSRRDY